MTVSVNEVETPPLASEIVTLINAEPLWLALGVTVRLRLAPEPLKLTLCTIPLASKLALGVSDASAVSGSPTVKVTVLGVSSGVVWLAIAAIVGASSLDASVTTNASEALSSPSLTVSVTAAVPDCCAAGVMVKVRCSPLPPSTMLFWGMRVVLPDTDVTSNWSAGVSTSLTRKFSGPSTEFSATRLSATFSMIGGSLTGVTVTGTCLVVLTRPSDTSIVKTAGPKAFRAGLSSIVRSAPLPPSNKPLAGIGRSPSSRAVTVRSSATLSSSSMPKGNAPVLTSSSVTMASISPMVGARLTRNVTSTSSDSLPASSVAMTLKVCWPLSKSLSVIPGWHSCSSSSFK